MSQEKEGAWAREYRQGRAAAVEQQRIANLIAVSASPLLSITERKRAIRRAARALGVRDGQAALDRVTEAIRHAQSEIAAGRRASIEIDTPAPMDGESDGQA